MKYFTLCLLLALGMLAQPGRAQTYLLPVSGTTSYTTCTGTLYDDGGPNGPFTQTVNGGVTLWPGTPGAHLKLALTTMRLDSVHNGLYVYDGTSTSAPLIGRFTHGLPTVYATNTAGALTVVLAGSGGELADGIAATISCVGSVPPPDVAVQRLRPASASMVAGDVLAVEARLANLSGQAAPYTLRYLLSADAVPSPDDLPLGSTPLTLAAGDWLATGLPLTVPAGTAPGRYYVLTVAEANGPADSNPANNVAAANLRVLPLSGGIDLAVLAAVPLTPLALGGTTTISTRVQNLGPAVAQAAPVGYYLSADSLLDSSDNLVGQVLAPVPTAGRFTQVLAPVQLPAAVPPGPCYLLCVADNQDRVIEVNEQNNVFALKINPVPATPDVTFDSYHAVRPNQAAAGAAITVQFSLRNLGNVGLDSVAVGLYLSDDRAFGASDVLLDRLSAGPLPATTWYFNLLTRTPTVPASTAAGRHYLLLVADPANQVAESNKANNVVAMTLDVVTPSLDLLPTSARLVYTAVPGNPLLTELNLTNQGSTAAYPGVVGYYLSTDNQLSPNDVRLFASYPYQVAGNSSVLVSWSLSQPVVIPAATAPGAYYLLLLADPDNQVAETNETNNLVALPMQVKAPDVDLLLSGSFGVPSTAAAGTAVQAKYTLQNDGTTTAYGVATGFYLSADPLLGADDVLVGSYRLSLGNSAAPNGYYTGYTSPVELPRTTPPGQYYLLAMADYLNEVAETNESNNLRAATLQVTAARPDLTFQSEPLLGHYQLVRGGTTSASSYVYNVGAGPAPASRVGFYLSPDPVYSASDVLLGSGALPALAAGNTAPLTGSLTVPAGTVPGRYYVLALADYLHQTNDANPDNDVAYTTCLVTAPLAAREQLAGLELQVLPVPVAAPTPLRVQLAGGLHPAATLTLYNALGQPVASRFLPAGLASAELPTTGLTAGVYVLRLSGEGLHAVRRVVVE